MSIPNGYDLQALHEVVHQEDMHAKELGKGCEQDDIAVILITETLVSLCPDLYL